MGKKLLTRSSNFLGNQTPFWWQRPTTTIPWTITTATPCSSYSFAAAAALAFAASLGYSSSPARHENNHNNDTLDRHIHRGITVSRCEEELPAASTTTTTSTANTKLTKRVCISSETMMMGCQQCIKKFNG